MTSTDVSPTVWVPQPATAPPAVSPLPLEAPRRGALRWLTGGGIALVAAVSGLFATAAPASASPACCNLYYPNGPYCPQSGCWFSCPGGSSGYVWTCLAGTRELYCAECITGGNGTCGGGPGATFVCSTWWDDGSC